MVNRQSHPREYKAYIYTKDFKTNFEAYDFAAWYLRYEIQSRPLELKFAVSWHDDQKAETTHGIVRNRIATYLHNWSPLSTANLGRGCLGPFRLAALLHAKSSDDLSRTVHQSVYLECRMTMQGIHRRFVLDHETYAWERESAATHKAFNLYQYRCLSKKDNVDPVSRVIVVTKYEMPRQIWLRQKSDGMPCGRRKLSRF